MRSTSLLVFGSVLLVGGCGGQTQDPQAVLYEWRSTDVTPLTDQSFSGTAYVGPEEKLVPLTIEWSSGRDADNCLRIAEIEIVRTGGDPGVVVSDVGHAAVPCAMAWESTDTTKFESAAIKMSYDARVGITSYAHEGASVATISGDGRMKE